MKIFNFLLPLLALLASAMPMAAQESADTIRSFQNI